MRSYLSGQYHEVYLSHDKTIVPISTVMVSLTGLERVTVVLWHSIFLRSLIEVIAFELPYFDEFTSAV